MTYAVIMAGGVGSRFWPKSRAKTPKQLLNIFGERTMIRETVERILPMIPYERIFIVTNILQAEEIGRQIPELPEENILIEPVGRNTAPCIGLAALHITRKDPGAVMAVLAADHLVRNAGGFRDQLGFAVQLASDTDASITLGIQPDRPVTGYGYIQFIPGETVTKDGRMAYAVKQFTEKPDLQRATEFVRSGEYLWNSGMFIWKADTLLGLIAKYLPELSAGLSEIGKTIGTDAYESTLNRVYHNLRGISIDYGVMEKTQPVYVIQGDFGWSDVGSWDEVCQILKGDSNGNILPEPNTLIGTKNSYFATDKYVAAIGIEDVILVETEDAILLCRRGMSQDVKKIVDDLEKNKRQSLL